MQGLKLVANMLPTNATPVDLGPYLSIISAIEAFDRTEIIVAKPAGWAISVKEPEDSNYRRANTALRSARDIVNDARENLLRSLPPDVATYVNGRRQQMIRHAEYKTTENPHCDPTHGFDYI